MTSLFRIIAALLVLVPAAFAGAIAFGTAAPLPELKDFSSPFRSVDFSTLPPLRKLAVASGAPVAFRAYGTGEKGVLIALHGSSAQGASLHPFALALAARGYAVYLPDLRGHGATGTPGDADYIYQPDDDLGALMALARSEHPGKPVNLAGFSLGAGLALGYAGRHPQAGLRRILLLAPALGPRSPTNREVQGWSAVHKPRVIALHILNGFGIHAYDHLEVITFAVPANSEKTQVKAYSHALLASLLPLEWKPLMRRLQSPIDIVYGGKDELFDTSRAGDIAAEAPALARVTLIPEASHISLSLDQGALSAIADLLDKD